MHTLLKVNKGFIGIGEDGVSRCFFLNSELISGQIHSFQWNYFFGEAKFYLDQMMMVVVLK